MKQTKAFKIAIGGVISAVSLALMMFTGVFPFGTYAFPVLAGIFLISIFWNLVLVGQCLFMQ